jgi:hypothetical protein
MNESIPISYLCYYISKTIDKMLIKNLIFNYIMFLYFLSFITFFHFSKNACKL